MSKALGESIAEAIQFLKGIYADICAQIKSLDRLMANAGWVMLPNEKVTLQPSEQHFSGIGGSVPVVA